MPEGVAEYAHLDTQNPVPSIETSVPAPEPVEANPYDVGYAGDDREVLNARETYNKGETEDIDAVLKDSLD